MPVVLWVNKDVSPKNISIFLCDVHFVIVS